jgi:hypothetical protein
MDDWQLMPLLPSNPETVLAELDRRMSGYGNGKQTAQDLKIEPRRLHEMKSGSRRINQKVAEGLGFELLWVKKETEHGD